MKWVCSDLFHFVFLCQVVMDSVSIVDDVGDWPPEVVQEESKEYASFHIKQINTMDDATEWGTKNWALGSGH